MYSHIYSSSLFPYIIYFLKEASTQEQAAGVHHVHGGVDGGVEQELLVGGEAGVGDSPAQVAAVHILAHPPIVLRLVQPDAAVMLERRCMDSHAMSADRMVPLRAY